MVRKIKIRPNKSTKDIFEYNVHQETDKALYLRVCDKNVPSSMCNYFWIPESALSYDGNVYEVLDWFWKIAGRTVILSLGRDDLLKDINFNS